MPDDDNIPQTTAVFDAPRLDFNSHQWRQEGYFVVDACPSKSVGCHTGGLPLPAGSLLVKNKGVYTLVDEITRESV